MIIPRQPILPEQFPWQPGCSFRSLDSRPFLLRDQELETALLNKLKLVETGWNKFAPALEFASLHQDR